MKTSVQLLRRNEVIKFSNGLGTHTMIVEDVQKCLSGREVEVSGTVVKTTNSGKCEISGINVGDSYFHFFKAEAKVQIVK